MKKKLQNFTPNKMTIKLEINPIKEWLPYINNPLLVSGPCSLESEEQAIETAKLLAKDKRVFIYRGGVWKPRTRPGSSDGKSERRV